MSVVEPPPPPLRVAVVGSSAVDEDEYELARSLGRELARRGVAVVCGGRGGVMEAVSFGAASAGGLTVGILPGRDGRGANPWILLPLATGMGEGRNALVVRAAESVVAVGGSWGTLSEIALARKMGREVALLGRPLMGGLELPVFGDPEAAAAWAVERARVARGEIPARR